MPLNIFIAIEDYLIAPNKTLAEKIKDISHEITNIAFDQAVAMFPGKKGKIGADEYMPILQENMRQQATQAYALSTRLVINSGPRTASDPEYIFRLTDIQQKVVKGLMSELLHDKKNRHPDGLIFAYDGYLERYIADEPVDVDIADEVDEVDERVSSNFSYCERHEATIRDRNTLLRLTIDDLNRRGYKSVAQVLFAAYAKINFLCKSEPHNNKENRHLLNQLTVILGHAKESDEVQSHPATERFLDDFMRAVKRLDNDLSIYTGINHRGSFWFSSSHQVVAQKTEEQQLDESSDGHSSPSPDSPTGQ